MVQRIDPDSIQAKNHAHRVQILEFQAGWLRSQLTEISVEILGAHLAITGLEARQKCLREELDSVENELIDAGRPR